MTRYRPVACVGRNLTQCAQCLRFTQTPEPNRAITTPEILDGRCLDHIDGRPRAPIATTSKKES